MKSTGLAAVAASALLCAGFTVGETVAATAPGAAVTREQLVKAKAALATLNWRLMKLEHSPQQGGTAAGSPDAANFTLSF